jgi:hypothetical protein
VDVRYITLKADHLSLFLKTGEVSEITFTLYGAFPHTATPSQQRPDVRLVLGRRALRASSAYLLIPQTAKPGTRPAQKLGAPSISQPHRGMGGKATKPTTNTGTENQDRMQQRLD